jgi:hypothetical protein
MQLARLLLAFVFMATWFGSLAWFQDFFHSSRPALTLMVCLFFIVTNRWHHWSRRLRVNDELTKLNLNPDTNHG